MKLTLSTDRRAVLRRELQAVYSRDLDEQLSDFQADAVLDCVLKAVGPEIYNQAVQDARAFMQSRLDDLEGEVYVDE